MRQACKENDGGIPIRLEEVRTHFSGFVIRDELERHNLAGAR
jgi:hypothetical protein